MSPKELKLCDLYHSYTEKIKKLKIKINFKKHEKIKNKCLLAVNLQYWVMDGLTNVDLMV